MREEEKYLILETIIKGIRTCIENSATTLELTTSFLNKHFEGLNADQLPEYQEAINAVRKYESALVKRFEKEYKKREEIKE